MSNSTEISKYTFTTATSTKKLDVQHFQHNIFIVTLQNFSTIVSQILLQFLAIFIRTTYMARCTRYNIMFVMDLRQVSGFLRVLRFPPPIKLAHDINEIQTRGSGEPVSLTWHK